MLNNEHRPKLVYNLVRTTPSGISIIDVSIDGEGALVSVLQQ